jgi:DNA replication protein DnaC
MQQVSVSASRFFNEDELDALREYSLGWSTRGEACPTCFQLPHVEGEYQFNGELHVCPLDDFGRHEQRWLFDLYSLAGIPYEFMTLDWGDFPEGEAKLFMDDFLARYAFWRARGRGMTLQGTFGTGKTWACCHVAKELAKDGVSVYFVPFWELVRLYDQPRDRRDYIMGRMLHAELLIIDDVQVPVSEPQRDLFESKFEEVVRQRAHASLPTLVTTNMDDRRFAKSYPRVTSVLSGKNESLALVGDDFRPHSRNKGERLVNMEEMEPIT